MIGWSVGGVVLTPYFALLTMLPRADLFVFINYFGLVLAASFLAGLIGFETLVYLGLRRLKYANPPGSEAELATPEAEPPESESTEGQPTVLHARTGHEPGSGDGSVEPDGDQRR